MKCAALLLLLPLVAARQDGAARFLEGPERERFLNELEQRMSARKTVAAEFEQEKVLALFDDPLQSRGVILFEAPAPGSPHGGKLRWEIQAPFQSILIVADDDVAKFEFGADGQRRALELGRAKDPLLVVMSQIRAWFLGRFDRRESSYRLRVAREPEPLIVLEPADAGLKRNLKAIEVSLSSALDAVSRVVVVERSGDRTTMSFREKRRDGPLAAGYFDLKAPLALDLAALLAPAKQE